MFALVQRKRPMPLGAAVTAESQRATRSRRSPQRRPQRHSGLVRSDLKLNQRHGSDGWLTEDALRLVRKTVCDKLPAYLLSQRIDGIPSDDIESSAGDRSHA